MACRNTSVVIVERRLQGKESARVTEVSSPVARGRSEPTSVVQTTTGEP
jgi:hypothetical protein